MSERELIVQLLLLDRLLATNIRSEQTVEKIKKLADQFRGDPEIAKESDSLL